MDRFVLLTSTPRCVVSPRDETTHAGVDVNNTNLSIINFGYNIMSSILVASIAVTYTPDCENTRTIFFVGDLACEMKLHTAWRHLLSDNNGEHEGC